MKEPSPGSKMQRENYTCVSVTLAIHCIQTQLISFMCSFLSSDTCFGHTSVRWMADLYNTYICKCECTWENTPRNLFCTFRQQGNLLRDKTGCI